MPPKANPYGFDHSSGHKTPLAQLRALLPKKVDADCFQSLHKSIRHLTTEYYDISQVASTQEEACSAVRKGLKKTFPEIFSGPDMKQRVYFALQVALAMHRSARAEKMKSERRKQKRDKDQQDNENIAPENGKIPNSIAGSPLSFSSNKQPEFESAKDFEDRSTTQIKQILSPHSRAPFEGMTGDENLPSTPTSSMLGSQRSECSSQTILIQSGQSRDSTTSSSLRTQYSTGHHSILATTPLLHLPLTSPSAALAIGSSNQHAAVIRFLDSCMPPMGHLLDRFIEFGCDTADLLFGMSLCAPEKIQAFLERLPPGSNGRPLSLTEVLVLQNHWETYFSA